MIACCWLTELTSAFLDGMVAGSTATSSRNWVFDMKWGCAFSLVIAFGSMGRRSAACGLTFRSFATPSRATWVKMKEWWMLRMVALERLHALSSARRALGMMLIVIECNSTSGTDRKQSTRVHELVDTARTRFPTKDSFSWGCVPLHCEHHAAPDQWR